MLLTALVFVAAWGLALRFGWRLARGFDREERLAIAVAIAVATLAGGQFVAFLTGAPQPWFCALVLLPTLAAPGDSSQLPWRLVLAFALVVVHLLALQAVLPHYVGSNWWGDWHHHYLASRVFLGELPVNEEWGGAGMYTVASRTPLYNLALAFLLNLSGTHFWAFQLASVLPSAAFALAVFLLLRDLFDRRAAWLGLLLCPLNLWMMHNAWFTWPKMLAAFYLVLGLHFYLQARRQSSPRYFFAFWICFLLSYLSHPVAVVYLVPVIAVALWDGWRPDRRSLAWLSGSAVVLLAPWYGWVVWRFGLSRLAGGTPVTQMDETATGPLHAVASAGYNLALSVYPLTLVRALVASPVSSLEVYRGLTELYFSLGSGALTVSLSLFLATRLTQTRALIAWLKTADGRTVAVTLLVGTLLGSLLHPMRVDHGIAHAALFSSVVLAVALAWGKLSQSGRWVAGVTILGMMVEFLGMFWSHLVYLRDPREFDPYHYNVRIQVEQELVFLHDLVGPTSSVVFVAAVQVCLIATLVSMWAARLQCSR